MHGTLETKLSRHFNPKFIRNDRFSEFLLQMFSVFYSRLKDPKQWQNVHGIPNYGRKTRQNVKQRKKEKKCDNQLIKSVCETEETTYCHLTIPISQCSLSRIAWPWKFLVSFPEIIVLFLLILILVYSCGRSVIEWLSIIYLG